MNLNDKYKYVIGESKFSEKKSVSFPTQEEFKSWVDIGNDVERFQDYVDSLQSHLDFYKIFLDLKNVIPPSKKEEFFYEMKNGFRAQGVPARFIWYMKHLYSIYNSANIAVMMLSDKDCEVFFSENYFKDGITARDVIKEFIDKDYEPLHNGNLRVNHGSYYEVYLPKEDMVALLPTKLANSLSDNDLLNIDQGENGLEIEGELLRSRTGYYGAINSVYDLRELI